MNGFLRAVIAILAISMVASISACNTWTTYKGPDLPDAKVAKLDGYYRFYFLYEEQTGVMSVDGSRAGGLVLGAGSVRLSPGRHWIGIQEFSSYPWAAGFRNCAFEMDFLAGHHYKVAPHSLSLEGPGGLNPDLSRGSISIEVQASEQSMQTLRVATVCAAPNLSLCRKDADCHQLTDKTMYRCNRVGEFDFGSCDLLQR